MISQHDLDRIKSSGRISDEDVLAMRREMYGDDHRINVEEAEALFALNDACEGVSNAWTDFFVEAIVDFVSGQSEPQGYVSVSHADWLIDKISASGIVKTATELELVVKVMEKSRRVPEALEVFTMQQVRHAVLNGDGVTRTGQELQPGHIGRGEVELLRRVLYACGGDDSAAISCAEAEVLFDINDAVVDVDNDPSWPDLFTKAIANYLMAARGYRPPSRAEALRREAWLDDTDTGLDGVGDFMGSILSGGLRAIIDAYKDTSDDGIRQQAAEIATAEVITVSEADWVADRIGRDGELADAERALLLFIKTESPNIHPKLQPLLEKVA
jgi:hypothetical protein